MCLALLPRRTLALGPPERQLTSLLRSALAQERAQAAQARAQEQEAWLQVQEARGQERER